MGWFEYQGLTPGGTLITGKVEAADRDQAQRTLDDMRLEVRELRDSAAPPPPPASLGADDLIFFNEQLASLAEAGISLDEGLAQLARDVESPRLRGWIEGLVGDLREGQSLEQAMAKRGSGLPTFYSDVVRAGVESGHLAGTLLNLNQHLRLQGNTRRILWETLAYPLVVGLLALTVVSVFFVFIIPQFEPIYSDFGAQLPRLTRMLLVISRHYPSVMLGLGVGVGGAVLAWRGMRLTDRGRRAREGLTLRIPILGQIYRASIVARFLRSVATAAGSGIPLPRAIRLSCAATGSPRLNAEGQELAAAVECGESIFKAGRNLTIIPPLFGFCAQTATNRNDLPDSIGRLAAAYEVRAVHTQSLLRAFLFPLFIIALGIFLGLAILGVFLPLNAVLNWVSFGV